MAHTLRNYLSPVLFHQFERRRNSFLLGIFHVFERNNARRSCTGHRVCILGLSGIRASYNATFVSTLAAAAESIPGELEKFESKEMRRFCDPML